MRSLPTVRLDPHDAKKKEPRNNNNNINKTIEEKDTAHVGRWPSAEFLYETVAPRKASTTTKSTRGKLISAHFQEYFL